MNNEFWKRSDGTEITQANGDLIDMAMHRNAALKYLDDTLVDLNDTTRQLAVASRNLEATKVLLVNYSKATNDAFDTLRMMIEELAYQTPYEDGQNAKVELVKGLLDRVRRPIPEYELDESGKLRVSSDIPF